jgi:hypothetical protein
MRKIIAMAFAGITLGMVALWAPTAQATSHRADDCQRVATADRALCRTVQRQHGYGWTDAAGNPLNWEPNGKALVHDITHQGLTKSEMHSYLTGEHASYREHVTAVTFNVDKIRKECGHTLGNGVVQMIRDREGLLYTWAHVVCD